MKFFLKNALFIFFLLLAGKAAAQTPATAPTPRVEDEQNVVVITTNLIQIDATVTDKNGNVVKDLKPEDFEIYENGKLQKITNFSFISQYAAKTNVSPRSEKSDQATPATTLPTVRPEQVRRTIALVVDDLRLSFANTRWVKDALKRFVDQQMQPGDLVAIVRTGSGVGAFQ